MRFAVWAEQTRQRQAVHRRVVEHELLIPAAPEAVELADEFAHSALGLPVDVGEQRLQSVLDEKEAVGLVVGAVDRHADVVEQRAARHDHLGVAVLHSMVRNHRRLDVALNQ